MARPIEWFQHLPRILAELEALAEPHLLNRHAIQALFRVERRNAQYLMTRFGAQRLGNALFLERGPLLAALRDYSQQDHVERRQLHHDRVRDVISQRRADLQLSRITLRETQPVPLADLPSSINLGPGRLSIDFRGAVDLLSQLLELSQAIGADFEHFERMLNQDPLSE